ncbi:hypothetical protein FACS1894123_07520 [Bacteroidia bacterium]|nr:hypothetical protein FACS1894123_07520 [Bacteroidia bacterium]
MNKKCVVCWEEVLPDVANVVAIMQIAVVPAPATWKKKLSISSPLFLYTRVVEALKIQIGFILK